MEGELIILNLFDVGRYIDLNRVQTILPGKREKIIMKSKDTPSYIDIPNPLIFELRDLPKLSLNTTEISKLNVRIYEDGVITLVLRINFMDFKITELHELNNNSIKTQTGDLTIQEYLSDKFNELYEIMKRHIHHYDRHLNPIPQENYTLYCIFDEILDIKQVIKKNDNYFAALLMGEDPKIEIHEKQIKHTLSHPFSFSNQDTTIFDFDRCLIFDSSKDHEDIVLIAELANYQLLELRTLDLILDESLTEAEIDIRELFFERRYLFKKVNKKLGRIFRLRYEMIFLLEHVDNISKFIGDFYLGQLYERLSALFQLKDWSNSVRYRVNALDKIYSTAKENSYERLLIILELLIVVIFIIDIILVIFRF